ncbi:type II toxin-antitoxin system HipA family toxin [Hephaestia sp. GCM10023244]|uniref:type II toxin-antitoxin system HipA family toxin n=1 Tax=unclassified Hephaestia TaxID=2631281 RepID=UPI00207722BA|nr:type II toxin-antitoxin system HipA family toxin [Hephaestia sp. MAHUQ-44]MCM8730920.1 type II toxin-antitoxin system HipA family toxin [Hephaestia sp. MAHUQ-44]
MIDRTLKVWWDDTIAGTLSQDRHGDLGFVYDIEWLRAGKPALSRSLPLREELFSRAECRPFFGGLLPEAGQRELAAGALGVSSANEFALLDRLGGDVAGALTLLPEGQQPLPAATRYDPRPLTERDLTRVLRRLPARPLLAGEQGLRLSLAGAQAKLPVVLLDGQPALPSPGQPTTHIIKPEIEHFPGSVENEAFCMALAARVGLPVAHAEARIAEDRRYLLVERYDRLTGADGLTFRLHQEDACQALGVPPERKYAAEGGPSFRDLFSLVRDYVRQPAPAVLNLLDVTIFNLIIGNADAHGKNFSFLLDHSGPRLAPFYDLLSTIHWPDLSPRMAMRLGGAGTISEIDDDAWANFAETSRTSMRLVRQRIERISTRIVNCVPTIGVAGDVGSAIVGRAELRARRIKEL